MNEAHDFQNPLVPITYVAIPYTKRVDLPLISEERYKANAERIASSHGAKLCEYGNIVFSPISNSHHMHLAGDLPHTWDYWERADKYWISKCTYMEVIDTGAAELSTGVQSEIEYAKELGLEINYHVMPEPTRTHSVRELVRNRNQYIWESYIGTIVYSVNHGVDTVMAGLESVSEPSNFYIPIYSTRNKWTLSAVEMAIAQSPFNLLYKGADYINFDSGVCYITKCVRISGWV